MLRASSKQPSQSPRQSQRRQVPSTCPRQRATRPSPAATGSPAHPRLPSPRPATVSPPIGPVGHRANRSEPVGHRANTARPTAETRGAHMRCVATGTAGLPGAAVTGGAAWRRGRRRQRAAAPRRAAVTGGAAWRPGRRRQRAAAPRRAAVTGGAAWRRGRRRQRTAAPQRAVVTGGAVCARRGVRGDCDGRLRGGAAGSRAGSPAQTPVVPSVRSRSRSAWPRWRAYSSIMCR